MRFYVTFGQREAREDHPLFAAAHPDGWVEIEADDEMAARRIAVKALGNRWSSIYNSSRELRPELYPRGRILLLGADPDVG